MTTEIGETTLDVRGMHCSSCVRHVDKALRALAGVAAVEVDLGGGKVKVTHEARSPSREAMAKAIDDAGYEVVGA